MRFNLPLLALTTTLALVAAVPLGTQYPKPRAGVVQREPGVRIASDSVSARGSFTNADFNITVQALATIVQDLQKVVQVICQDF
ncbi:hypothetical protein FB45DRAFT_1062440 [Roridomyces roridus]|uniref:Uncharacterized protein n=1 Tax=Roridomyces roridus TaxID=1738132 RepID=A0AAD7B0R7_9AGAR|nr:hypothetical protein FB45DRAFT_1068032 [Roridomyces roridus]KAJ7621486.1 hypothetical protein FB45DRAFT_1062440 [Roridomyces roridus]